MTTNLDLRDEPPYNVKLKAEIERLQSQLSLATGWNNTLIRMAGLEGSWVDGGVSVRQVADALCEIGKQQPKDEP